MGVSRIGMEMPSDNRDPDPLAKWVIFRDGSAALRRMVKSDGEKGLLLQFTGLGAWEEVRQRALTYGFSKVRDSKSLMLMARSRVFGISTTELAAALGGDVVEMPLSVVHSYPWTADYMHPDLGKGLPSVGGPKPAAISLLGWNHLGEEVLADAEGTRYRKGPVEEGRTRYYAETANQDRTLFLRAEEPEDLPRIAAGLLWMAKRGTVSREEFKKIAAAAAEPAKPGGPRMEAGFVEEALKDELVERIIGVSVEDDASRESYHRAMRLGEHLSGVVNEASKPLEGLFPSIGFLIFLRRLVRETGATEVSGNERLRAAVQVAHGDGEIWSQLYDLTTSRVGGAAERAANILARRTTEGSSVLIVAGGADSEAAEDIRGALGLVYAIENVAEIAPHVATGRHDGGLCTAFVIGERRPLPAEGLPVAAQRTFKVLAWEDLDGLHREVLRSRTKIRDWHLDAADAEAREIQEREDNERQRPYVALSELTPPFTMIPKALEGATAKALRRVGGDQEEKGGIDGWLAGELGVSRDDLAGMLTSEQADAVALRKLALDRNRGFLLADQTGVGKGRSLAAMCRLHARSGGNVLYLTENADINIPDVWRDISAVGGRAELKPAILASRPVALEGVDSGSGAGTVFRTESAASRRRMFGDAAWPGDRNLVLTNYSQFSRGEDSPAQNWAGSAPDASTLLVLDECHNALNPESNTGKAVRAMIEAVGRSNVVFATATPLRNIAGAELYKPLLPDADGDRLDGIFASLAVGGETAQESFATMLAEDGVFIRRDHDLSNLEFQVRLPDDARMSRYQDIMNLFSPMVEQLLDTSLEVQALVGRAQAVRYREMINRGHDPRAARAETNALYQYSGAAGGPLARLARLTINALKVEQVVEEALNEISAGRKPLISFHSTGAGLFTELATRGGEAETAGDMSLADQIMRVAEGIFRVRVDDEVRDARLLSPEIEEASQRIRHMVERIPRDLPVSPIDALIESLTAHGVSVGEISGRALAYRAGRIVRREGTDRRQAVDDFNSGDLDVLIYNSAGATGGSYHASTEFRDQRPRSIVEMETPVDIIKYVQSQGRGNRYGQVAKPRVVSVVTGLIPEMRILQQRNRKLRSMGAIIDGNRSHPLLFDDVPDFLNVVGDRAAMHVLLAKPDLTRRLGFQEIADGIGEDQADTILDRGGLADSGASSKLAESLANKVLTRSLVLSAAEQSELVELIRYEFDAVVEELESRNLNPLKPKEIQGEIDVLGTTLFSGLENPEGDLDVSAFFAPLYMSTGVHRFSEEPIGSEELVRLVNNSMIADGADGFARHADRLESMLPNLLRTAMRPDTRLEDAMADLANQPHRFRLKHQRLTRLIHLLRNIRPGRAVQLSGFGTFRDDALRTIVKTTAPDLRHADWPQAYKIRTVTPGDTKPEIISLRRLLRIPSADVRFSIGLERGRNERHLRNFEEQSKLERQLPVQVLAGNHLAAILEARRHSLGTMSLYKEASGQMQRGIVVHQSKADLRFLPVVIPSGRVAAAVAAMAFRGRIKNGAAMWVGKRDNPLIRFDFVAKRGHSAMFSHLPAANQQDFYGSRPDLAALKRSRRRRQYAAWPSEAELIDAALRATDGLVLMADGRIRDQVNEVSAMLERGEFHPWMNLLEPVPELSCAPTPAAGADPEGSEAGAVS